MNHLDLYINKDLFMQEDILQLRKNLDNDKTHIIDKLRLIIQYIRPTDKKEIESTLQRMDEVIQFFQIKDDVAQEVSSEINLLFIDSKMSTNISNLGILSHNGFRHEISKRFYNKFLPAAPKKGDFRYIFSVLFDDLEDQLWVNAIENEQWISFFSSLMSSDTYQQKMKDHFFSELLYAAEILSIKIASEEFDDNFIRLDYTLLDKDSSFIALHREINKYVHKIQEEHIDLASTRIDILHIHVLIDQCKEQVDRLKRRSLNKGISIELTYELERIGQMVQRIEEILILIKQFDTPESYLVLIELFKASVTKNASKNSLYEIYQQSIRMLAKSVTKNTGEHGEHYITKDHEKYIKMFFSACGAGIIIAFMALSKINIMQAEFSAGIEAILSSLNYSLGFVLIHLLGFTIATKQPAMTASTFAKAIEQGNNRRANQKKLVELFIDVNRTQFAAVIGNMTFALLIAWGISYAMLSGGNTLLSIEESEYYLTELEPYPALLYAAIAGVWLFCSGLIAGYFDNRANLLELRDRYYHHPFLKKLMKNSSREKLAIYLHNHHGAIAGNFFFGILLGVTPFIGYLLDLQLDISHVAFSTAYLGYSSIHLSISIDEFLRFLFFVLLIGLVNLSVSFTLALKVSLLSRDSYFGNLFSFIKLLAKEIFKKPFALFVPPIKKYQGDRKNR